MDAKEYLRGIRKISYQIKEKREEIATLQAQIEGGSAGFESDGTQSGHTDTERNAHMIMDLTALKDELDHQSDMLILAMEKAIRLIMQMDDPVSQSILQLRYVRFESWESISTDLNYSVRHVHRLHAIALGEFQRILDEM